MHKTIPIDSIATRDLKTPTPRLNLSSAEDVRREMGKVYRDARLNIIPSSEATRLVYILSQILKSHELLSIEKRIVDLEQLQVTGGYDS
jgi:hypothetical protein